MVHSSKYPRVHLDDSLEWVESTAAPNKKGPGPAPLPGDAHTPFCTNALQVLWNQFCAFQQPENWLSAWKTHKKKKLKTLQPDAVDASSVCVAILTHAVKGGMTAGDTNKLAGWLSVWR